MTFILDREYDAMFRRGKWDSVTQDVISARIENETEENQTFSFLNIEEGEHLRKLIEILVPQYSGGKEIRIAEVIDGALSFQKIGVRYGENLWKGEMYKKGLGEVAKLQNISTEVIAEVFFRPSEDFLRRFLRIVLTDSSEIYFSHPASWNKIGFPGPAFPEGYAYLGCGEKDSWEPEYLEEKKQ